MNQKDQLLPNPHNNALYLSGPTGTGKTSAGVERVEQLFAAGAPADQILVLVPQKTLAAPYFAARDRLLGRGGRLAVTTAQAIAQQIVRLVWREVAAPAGFAHPERPPIFLTSETAQYVMARLTTPLMRDRQYFDGVHADRYRIFGQLLDNLNKAAFVGLDLASIGERLSRAWDGDPGRLNVYRQVQDCIDRFRAHTLEHNLLDVSLQVDVFWKHAWPRAEVRDYLRRTYRYLVADRIDDETPFGHDLIRAWLPDFDSALLILDEDGGARTFLGADPAHASALAAICDRKEQRTAPVVDNEPVARLLARSEWALGRRVDLLPDTDPTSLDARFERLYPMMLDEVAAEIGRLVGEKGMSPHDIVVLAPFLSGATIALLGSKLEAHQIGLQVERPSRPLRAEGVVRALITLARLAHPSWGLPPTFDQVSLMLAALIRDLDPVRAAFLTRNRYVAVEGRLNAYRDVTKDDAKARIGRELGSRYDRMVDWLAAYGADGTVLPIDVFLSQVFDTLLAHKAFTFHGDTQRARPVARLIESARKFRVVLEQLPDIAAHDIGREYVDLVDGGVIGGQYVDGQREVNADRVRISPAYTFLLSDQTAPVQLWIDITSPAWGERLLQPLTQPYVLRRSWTDGRRWTDLDNAEANRDIVYQILAGLLRRCTGRVIWFGAERSESGYQQAGPLLSVVQRLHRAGARGGGVEQ